MISFNPRVLAGGRDNQREFQWIGNLRFQSTRPRGRTRPYWFFIFFLFHVSIHASSREDATYPRRFPTVFSSFNPRVLAGGRDSEQKTKRDASPVSIHASSREDATGTPAAGTPATGFNPRVLAGGRDA